MQFSGTMHEKDILVFHQNFAALDEIQGPVDQVVVILLLSLGGDTTFHFVRSPDFVLMMGICS